MAPKRDRVSKDLSDGMRLVWDTNKVDRGRARRAATVSAKQSAALREIVGESVRSRPRDSDGASRRRARN
jgi:hypothetical protein